MVYTFELFPPCQEAIKKHCKKNPVLEKALNNKIEEICQNPEHYKPLKYDFAGERRVHIMRSFVLRFKIDEINKIVVFLVFEHHDDAYRR